VEGSPPRPICDGLRAGLQGAAFGSYGVAIRIALVGSPDAAALTSAAYSEIGEGGTEAPPSGRR
jgi:hypothetical protein